MRSGIPTVLAAAAAVIGFWLFCGHMRSGALTADWPWLYRAGLMIWQHGLPDHDTLSWTFDGHPWVLYQWAFEAISAPIYQLLGPSASVMAVCLVGLGMYMLWPAWYLARRGINPWITLAVGGLVLIPVSVNLGLRPMLASNLALMAQIMIVERLRREHLGQGGAALALAGVYVLWANTHLGFTLGLASLVMFALADLIERRPVIGVVRRYGVLFGVAVAATGANPYGWSLYVYIVELSFKTAMNAHIHELQPADLANPYMAAGLALIVVYALLVLSCGRRAGWAGVCHVALFTVGTADSLRFVVWAGLFYVVAAPPLIQHVLARYRAGPTPEACRIRYRRLLSPVLVAAFTVAVFASAATAGPVRLAGCGAQAAAIRHLDERLAENARWFSSERTGSCTHIDAPGRRVFIDTRFDMYPEAFVMNWFRAYQYRKDWQALFAHWHIQAALLGDDAPLTPILSRDPDFSRERAGAGMWLFTTADAPLRDTNTTRSPASALPRKTSPPAGSQP